MAICSCYEYKFPYNFISIFRNMAWTQTAPMRQILHIFLRNIDRQSSAWSSFGVICELEFCFGVSLLRGWLDQSAGYLSNTEWARIILNYMFTGTILARMHSINLLSNISAICTVSHYSAAILCFAQKVKSMVSLPYIVPYHICYTCKLLLNTICSLVGNIASTRWFVPFIPMFDVICRKWITSWVYPAHLFYNNVAGSLRPIYI